jgi:hypothetical protein
LNNYFVQVSAPKRLELLESKRLMEKVDLTNKILANNLKTTAFTQCAAGDENDPVTKNLCDLQNEKLSVEKRLDLIHSLMGQENYLGYLPAINTFFSHHNPKYFSENEKKELALISENKIIKDQIIGLIDKTKSIGLKNEWASFAANIGFITPEEQIRAVKASVTSAFDKKISDDMLNIICHLDYSIKSKLNITLTDIKNKDWGNNELNVLNCLEIKDKDIYQHVADRLKLQKDQWAIVSSADFLINNKTFEPKVDPAAIAKVKTLIASNNSNLNYSALRFMAVYSPKDPVLHARVLSLITSNIEDNLQSAIRAAIEMKDADPKFFKPILQVMKTSKDTYTAGMGVDYFTLKKVKDPQVISELRLMVENKNIDQYDRTRLKDYLATIE